MACEAFSGSSELSIPNKVSEEIYFCNYNTQKTFQKDFTMAKGHNFTAHWLRNQNNMTATAPCDDDNLREPLSYDVMIAFILLPSKMELTPPNLSNIVITCRINLNLSGPPDFATVLCRKYWESEGISVTALADGFIGPTPPMCMG